MPMRALILTLCVTALAACATTPDAGVGPSKKTHYTLRTGEPLPHAEPQSTATPVFIDWYYDNGTMVSSEGFKGWDFDGDGRFDMLQVFAEDGKIQALAFDFDGDGRIDATQAP